MNASTSSARPTPRILAGELSEPPHQRQPRLDRLVLVQKPSTLLPGPAHQHGLEHRRRRIQLHNAGGQHQMRRPRQIHNLRHVAFNATSLNRLRLPGFERRLHAPAHPNIVLTCGFIARNNLR
jgi:hypothetical protein